MAEYQEVESRELVTWEEAKTLEGRYLGAEEKVTRLGPNLIHSVALPNGEVVAFFGTTQLNDKLGRVKVGSQVKIEYTGNETATAAGKMKEFKVYFK